MTGLDTAIGIGSMVWAVRRATDEDALAVRAVAVVAWRDTYAGILCPETIESFLAGPYAIGNVRARIAQPDVLVVEAGLEIVAYAAAIAEVARLSSMRPTCFQAVDGEALAERCSIGWRAGIDDHRSRPTSFSAIARASRSTSEMVHADPTSRGDADGRVHHRAHLAEARRGERDMK